MTSEPKKFDAVTIVGLALAVAIMFFGMKYSAPPKNNSSNGGVQQPAPIPVGTTGGPVNPAPLAIKEAAETPDITVAGKYLELTFASRGASIKSARLPGIDEDPRKKDKKGLDLLTEIEPGKRTFGMPLVDITPPKNQPSVEGVPPLPELLLDGKASPSPDQRVWALRSDNETFDASGIRTIVYELDLDKYVVTKTFTIDNNPMAGQAQIGGVVRCDVKIENKAPLDVTYFYWINGPQGILLDIPIPEPPGSTTHSGIGAELAARMRADPGAAPAEPDVVQLYATSAKTDNDDGRSVSKQENLWGAVKNRFFMASLVSLDPAQLVKIRADFVQAANHLDPRFSEPNIGIMGIRTTGTLNKDTVRSDPYALYLGPADDRHIDAAEAAIKPPAPYHMRMAIQFFDSFGARWPRVDWLARQMMWLFTSLHKLFGSFGIAVALMTIIIKLCLHPLQRKMMVSMSKMAKLQPELNKIKEKYKNATGNEAKMKMTMEQQDLMRKQGVSPAGGCLPMFIQIPIFTALYGIFNHAFDMRGAGFLWIKDLSQPDRLATLSFWPYSLNLLPILYIVLSFIQTRMTPQQKSDDPQQEMNRKMMMFMPVMISLMFYSMPAGLVLYFAVSACWGMLESWYIKKFVIKDPGPTTPGASTAGAAKPVAALAK